MTEKNRILRLRGTYITAIISITLVLFLFGLFGYFIINIGRVVNYLREGVEFSVVIKDRVTDEHIADLQKAIETSEFSKSAFFVSKSDAAETLKKDLGQDFESFLGYNPLRNTIDVKILPEFSTKEKLEDIERELLAYAEVIEVRYDKNLSSIINIHLSNIGIGVFVLSLLLLLIFSVLINDIIRVSLYSKRFIINTMLLVGATHKFILRPYVRSSIAHGMLGACFANLLILLLFMLMRYHFEALYNLFFEVEIAVVVGIGIFISGFLTAWIATTISVNKFLKLNRNELFY